MNKLLLLFVFITFIGVASASPVQLNLTSNTIYQNTNSTPLAIYVITHSATLHGYLGPSNTTLLKVVDLRGGGISVSGVVYSLMGYNMSAYMLVEPHEYYKFNYTNATFIGQYIPLSTQTYLINSKYAEAPQYSGIAQIVFAIGVITSLFLILLVFRILKFNVGIMGGLEGFAVGMIGALLIIYALQFTSQVTIPAYQITAFNSILNVSSQTALSTPLASQLMFGILGYSFIFMDFILGFIYLFMSMLVYRDERKQKKYGR